MKLRTIQPSFVEFIPKELDEGVLYISEKYKVAVHKCASGCGEKVVTALSPADWQVRKRGDLVSLHPSIGNWNFACRSHYWIRENRIVWAGDMSDAEVARVQQRDRIDKARLINRINAAKDAGEPLNQPIEAESLAPARGWWRRLADFVLRK
jgi:hypothetical protein